MLTFTVINSIGHNLSELFGSVIAATWLNSIDRFHYSVIRLSNLTHNSRQLSDLMDWGANNEGGGHLCFTADRRCNLHMKRSPNVDN